MFPILIVKNQYGLGVARYLKSLSENRKWMGPNSAFLGFLEGSFVPFPMEPLFIPMMASVHRRAWLLALWMVVGNVAGAALMYALGAMLLEPVVEPLMATLNMTEDFEEASKSLKENAFIALFTVGITPIPFQVGAAAAGAVGVLTPIFLFAVSLSRGIRYLALAGLVMLVGQRASALLKRYEKPIFIGGLLLFIGIIAAAML
ncbi:YqaA family protein [Hyphococcus sp. DH-69]|uniref:YqaA family protein n=1 Tax=Hyphococcus formosus TaxID=3143534 RepID=UPI00398B12A9